jgi:hypothetical protein
MNGKISASMALIFALMISSHQQTSSEPDRKQLKIEPQPCRIATKQSLILTADGHKVGPNTGTDLGAQLAGKLCVYPRRIRPQNPYIVLGLRGSDFLKFPHNPPYSDKQSA